MEYVIAGSLLAAYVLGSYLQWRRQNAQQAALAAERAALARRVERTELMLDYLRDATLTTVEEMMAAGVTPRRYLAAKEEAGHDTTEALLALEMLSHQDPELPEAEFGHGLRLADDSLKSEMRRRLVAKLDRDALPEASNG